MSDHEFCKQCGTRLDGADQGRGTCPRCLLGLGLDTTPIHFTGAEGRSAAPDLEEVAALLPKYELLEVIGRGGMGAVYKARQRDLQRVVAVKVLLPDLGRDPSFAERFLREAQALAQLDHPGLVDVYDFGRSDEIYYFVMEYVDGTNLRELVAGERLDPKNALGFVGQICRALQYAHDRGVVHRDIKPENILVDRQGRVKITDFGLAKLASGSGELQLTRSDQVMGTVHYMAPEQIERPHTVDHRADLYSLGVVFYEMLTGELPLGRFQPPSQRAKMDGRIDPVVMRALEKEPSRRYQRAAEISAEVQRISTTQATPPPIPEPARVSLSEREEGRMLDRGHRSTRHGSRFALTMGLVFAVAIVLAIGLTVAMRLRDSAELHSQTASAEQSSELAVRSGEEARQRQGPRAQLDWTLSSGLPRFRSGQDSLLQSHPAGVNDLLDTVFEEYCELEAAAMSFSQSGPELAIQIGSFAEDRAALAARLSRGLEDRLENEWLRDQMLARGLESELMPFGDRPVVVTVRRDPVQPRLALFSLSERDTLDLSWKPVAVSELLTKSRWTTRLAVLGRDDEPTRGYWVGVDMFQSAQNPDPQRGREYSITYQGERPTTWRNSLALGVVALGGVIALAFFGGLAIILVRRGRRHRAEHMRQH